MRFSSSKYTKMRLRPGLCPGSYWESLQRSPDPIAAGGRGLIAPPENPTAVLDHTVLRASSFRPLASNKLCIPVVGHRRYTAQC